MKETILIVEDEKDIVKMLEYNLKKEGFHTISVRNGEQAVTAALKEYPNLILLDIMLPGMDGLEVCKEIRKSQILTPILMLTSKSEEIDKVLGLELGADDYLTKPFSIREFIARVKAIFRRVELFNQTGEDGKDINYKDVVIEISTHKVLIKNKRIDLTPKEFDLFYLMASHPGRVYSRENLLNIIWGYQHKGYEHTVNSHINRLRSKIEQDISDPQYILTNWGSGYRFNDQII